MPAEPPITKLCGDFQNILCSLEPTIFGTVFPKQLKSTAFIINNKKQKFLLPQLFIFNVASLKLVSFWPNTPC